MVDIEELQRYSGELALDLTGQNEKIGVEN